MSLNTRSVLGESGFRFFQLQRDLGQLRRQKNLMLQLVIETTGSLPLALQEAKDGRIS